MSFLTEAFAQDVITFGLHLLYALIVVILGMKLAAWLGGHIKDWKLLAHIDASVASFIAATSTLVLRMAVLVAAALILGVPGSAFITLFGSAGVAIGLALQGSLSNLAGGLMLLFFHPFGVGDYIKAGDNEGTVVQISAFYTTIRTFDNKRIVLPNGNLTNSTLVNYSAEPTRMLSLKFSVAYDSDPQQVRRILLKTAKENVMVLADPAPTAPMTQQGDSALVFTLRVWVRREDCVNAEYELLEAVKLAFDAENIAIPYPQMDVHVKQ